MNGQAGEEFPPLPKFNENKKVKLSQEKMKGMLKRTSFAASADETRYVLNGILMSVKDQKVTMVATDGRRLAMTDEEVETTGNEGEVIIPTKAVNELNRLL